MQSLRRMAGATALVLAAVTGCGGGAALRRGPGPDAPVPAGEPRRTLKFVLDLPPGADCEQRFDLALYENRGIDLIEWSDGDGCRDRRVRVIFLPRRTAEAEVRTLITQHSTRVEELKP